MQVECCTDSLPSSLAAYLGGAHRLELCSNLNEGGVTISFGTFSQIRQNFPGLFLACLIRPRAGDFVYGEDEVNAMCRDIALFRAHGANGVVFGALTREGELDLAVMRRLVRSAHSRSRKMELTCHRAIDCSRSPLAVIDQCKALGITRVLSSGAAPDCLSGCDMLREMVQRGGKEMTICAAAGVTPENCRMIVERAGVVQLHGSFRSAVHPPFAVMPSGGESATLMVCDSAKVRAVVQAVRGE